MQPGFTGEVRSFVVDNFLLGREEGLSNDDSFLERGIIDSTGILELVSYLEETYEIEITEDELIPDNLDSINRIGTYLDRKLNRARGTKPAAVQDAACPA
jgi:acyl carrier protein